VLVYAAIGFSFISTPRSHVSNVIDACISYRAGASNLTLKNNTKKLPPKEISFYSSLDSLDDAFIQDTSSVFDTTQTLSDSINIADTLAIDSTLIDSTARVKYFKYHREDRPYVELKKSRPSSFFAEPSSAYKQKTIEIDSTGKFVEIREKIAGKETKILLRMPIEEYIDLKLALRERELWEELGYKYELKQTQIGLGELIKDITDFEIPLPSVGVLSIFGEPKISLKIGGAVDIHGAFRSETTEGITISRLGNTKNEPDFKQEVQINVNGTIGDKLNISADWNTERTFEYENQLKIKYTGYEDEIIQSIEAGNVSLQTSPLVGGSEALFGVKALFKMGPLSLTALASQKKGEVKEVSVSGGTTAQDFVVRAYEYSQNHYFLDTLYAGERLNLFNLYYGRSTPITVPEYRVTDIQVWKSINVFTADRSKERKANAYINLPPIRSDGNYNSLRGEIEEQAGVIEKGRFLLLTRDEDYTLHEETGYITFKTQIQRDEIIAVAYRMENGPGTSDDSYYGEFLTAANTDTSITLVLKLIKPRNLLPGTEAWKLQLKNIYPVGVRNLKQEGFEFQIKYEIEGQEPVVDLPTGTGVVRLLSAFGLDSLDASSNPNPDNVFDYRPGITIFPTTGEIIFPTLEPFGNNLPEGIPSELAFNEVYDTTSYSAKNKKERDKWILTGKSSGEASASYSLGFNVVENSVRVLLNGRELTQGVDYIVDYNIGELTIRNSAALVPGADLRITYEQNDLFQLASKTLLGLRGVIDFSNKTKLGFSFLNLNQETLSDKVRIGEEPLSNTIYGVDFSTSADLPFLTKLLDNVISTRQMSSLTLNGEYAYIDPDPNTKKSTISSDQGKSIAYIDDFEGAKRTIPIGVTYTAWKDLSPPNSLPFLSDTLTPLEKMPYKGKSWWYTITPGNVDVREIWPLRQASSQDQRPTVLDYVFLPTAPGMYNYIPTLENPVQSWGGIMKVLSSTASNLEDENIEFIEFWARIDEAPAGSKIYIDLGNISEDVIPNRQLDTEDPNNIDAIRSEEDDTGLDGLFDDGERAKYGVTESDPAGDNFAFTPPANQLNPDPFAYYNINGTQENSRLTETGKLPDTEDLNKNGSVDLLNSYFRYEISLDTNAAANPFISGGGSNGWYQYRIPLKENSSFVGNPTLSNVEFIRLFVTGVNEMVHLRFAEFNLVGSQWQKVLKEDSILSVSVINFEDNPNYSLPPGVFQERDRSKPDEEVFRNEQSLNLILKDLPDGQSREVTKFLYRPLDVFNYSEMKLFVHGDTNVGPGSVSDTSGRGYSSEVYFKFGSDPNNYYEYRQPVKPGWNEISIPFSELTAIKQERGNVTNIITRVPVPGHPGHFYQVQGNPSLTSIKVLTVGVYNVEDQPGVVYSTVSGEVWINELRVVGADDSPGWAYNFSSSLRMADLMTVNFNMSQTNPYFHRLADRFGSRVETKNWAMSTDLDVLKLLPINLPESNLKINYSHNESLGKPLYIPGTDIRVSSAAEQLRRSQNDTSQVTSQTPDQLITETQTLNISDSWSASGVKLKIPSSFWLIRDSFNALTFGFNYNKSFSRSPTILSNKSWVWNANINYGLQLSPEYFISPVDIPVIGSVVALFTDYKNTKIYFTPQNFTFTASAKRNRTVSVTRPRVTSVGITEAQEDTTRDFNTARGFTFNWKLTEGGLINLSTNYSVNISSSLAYLEKDIFGKQRPENEIWRDILSGAFFGRDYSYQQSFDLRSSPRLPSLWDINKYFTITASYSVNYQWNYDFRQEVLGRSAGFANKTSLGLTLRLKALTDPLFKSDNVQTNKTNTQNQRGRGEDQRNRRVVEEDLNKFNTQSDSSVVSKDTLITIDSLEVESEPKSSPVENALLILKTAAKVIFFEYESLTFNFSTDNNLSKSGIAGEGTGFNNFWGFSHSDEDGPTRGFMFGLNRDVGARAILAGTTLNDVFSNKNSFDFKTSKPLWEGAKIDLNWKVGWSVNKNTKLTTDQNGNLAISNITSTGSLNRSFLSLPPVLFLSIFKSGITRVNELYDPESSDPTASLSSAFVEGFETLPLFSKLFNDIAKYIPRPNWRITWDGLEKFFIFQNFTKRVTFDHSYSSTYTENWKINPDGLQEIQTQRVEYGFTPLAGLNFTFGELWGGNLTSSLKYSTRTNYDLGITTRNITETFSKEIGITAGYSKSGFEIPLFGLSLKNDIDFTFSYTSTQNSIVRFEMNNFTEEGIPQDGTIRTTIEPRIKYTLSSKVTLSIFYRRSSVEPEGASRLTPTTTNEAGLDVHISIQ
jgi:cell surface protein SprA